MGRRVISIGCGDGVGDRPKGCVICLNMLETVEDRLFSGGVGVGRTSEPRYMGFSIEVEVIRGRLEIAPVTAEGEAIEQKE